MAKEKAESVKLNEEQKAELKRMKELLGIYVCQERERHRLTQAQLAERTGLSPNHISKIERGCGDVKSSNLLKICLELELSLDSFLLNRYLADKPEAVSYREALNRQRTEEEKMEVQEAVNMAIEKVYQTRGLK